MRLLVTITAALTAFSMPVPARAQQPAAEPAQARTLFRGTLTRAADRLLLRPCDGGPAERVRDVSIESSMSAVLADLGFDRAGAIYLEAFGHRAGDEVLLDRLNRAGDEMQCPPPGPRPMLVARGNEPGWALVADAQRVTFSQPGTTPLQAPPQPLLWRSRAGRPGHAEGTLNVATESATYRLVLVPNMCRDTMATAAFGFTATLERSQPGPRATLKGCGFLDAPPPQ